MGLSDRIKEEDKMTERWTDERLDRFANKIDEQAERINTLIENIGQLVQSLYLEFPNINWCYVEAYKTLTPSPSPKGGEGNKKLVLLPFSLNGRGGWGVRAIFVPRNINIKAEINSISEEARETREVLSQLVKESNDRMTRIEHTLDRQTAIADKQADSVRQLIEMLNRKQA